MTWAENVMQFVSLIHMLIEEQAFRWEIMVSLGQIRDFSIF